MKKTLLILAALMIATAAYAVDASKGTAAGTKALLFSASGFDAANFGGTYAIGMKYYLSNGLALRPVVKFGYSTQTDKITPSAADSGGPAANRWHRTFDDTKASTTGFGLDLGIEKSILSKGAVNVHVGGVAGFSMNSYSRDSAESYTWANNGTPVAGVSEKITWKQKQSTTAFSVAGLLGAEWFITDNISLGGEYQFGLGIGSTGKDETAYNDSRVNAGVTTIISNTQTNPKVSTMAIGFSTVGLVLGIRF
jgi:opacity protein-like surface antigen